MISDPSRLAKILQDATAEPLTVENLVESNSKAIAGELQSKGSATIIIQGRKYRVRPKPVQPVDQLIMT